MTFFPFLTSVSQSFSSVKTAFIASANSCAVSAIKKAEIEEDDEAESADAEGDESEETVEHSDEQAEKEESPAAGPRLIFLEDTCRRPTPNW